MTTTKQALTFLFVLLFSHNNVVVSQTTITLQPGPACGKDAILHGLASQTNVNYGAQPQHSFNAWTFSGVFGAVRSVIEFDLSSIPAGATITNAQLSLYAWSSPTGFGAHSGNNLGWLSRVTSPWVESTVTWNTSPTFTTVNQVALPISTGPNQDYLNIPVTALVQDMINNPATSFGFIGQMQVESIYRRLNFCSSDHAIPARHPKLVVTYTSATPPPPPPIINLGPDTNLCAGQSIPLNISIANATYLWQDNSTNQNFTVTTPGTYTAQATTCTGVYFDTIVVSGGGNPINLGNDTTLCPGQTLILDATTPNATYLWQDNSTAATYAVSQAGTYYVDVDVNGCVVYDTINVLYNTSNNVDLGQDTTLCPGQSLTLDATVPNATYTWQDNSTAATFLVNQAGTYWVDANVNGCIVTDSILVNFEPTLSLNLGPDTTLCSGQNLFLNPNVTNVSYLWQDATNNSTFNVLSAGTYSLQISNVCSSASDTINVTYIQLPSVDLGPDEFLCSGQTINLDASFPNSTYIWQDNSTSSNFLVSTPGTYFVNVSTLCGTSSDTILIADGLAPQINLGNDTSLCFGKNIILGTATNFNSYIWQNGQNSNSILVTQAGQYYLTVTTLCGSTSDTINISLVDCDCSIYVPNAFTPDENEFNDEFTPVFECNLFSYEFTIFNRWGQVVFESKDEAIGWDGTYGGRLAPDGVYNYSLKYTTEDNINHVINGHVNKLR